MLSGGLLCERRNSGSPAQKAALPADCARAAATVSDNNNCLPVQMNHRDTPNPTDLLEPLYVYSEEKVKISDGHYEYTDAASSLVGHGSYGTVFRGTDRHTDKTIAIKKMLRINVKPCELEAMKRVSNPNLVSLIDICDGTEELTYLIMELCDNDLDRHLRCKAIGGKLGAPEIRTVIRSIAQGYFALYQKQIVHRDIKPQNILLIYDACGDISTAKLTDFGVSRVLADDGKLCNVAGTLFFMSPEVGANLVKMCEYDHLADMWSIGCVIYQCHTGQMPFDECSLCRLFLHFAGGNYDAYDLPDLPDDTSTSLRMLISSLLEIDRAKRATPQQFYNSVVLKSVLS
ncbi:protein kinase domain-containing protein [Ditylenchus destructor]|uniref:Protein kinase domain-containing protein n=1 Tax=Ditylenchus destructor TaxID=166010 RepID=A0AAD4R7V8_9BILA|nr:protein kinase domain-containing protein [Ditylenchus destructor]